MARLDVRGHTALVTGASSGIGREFARLLAEKGAHLIVTARREAELEELARELRAAHGVRVEVIRADLGLPAEIARLADQIGQRGLVVDHLIDNAGFGRARPFVKDDPALLLSLLDVNCRAATDLALRFLPGMIERRRGGILLVASLVGFFPIPGMAVYAASKAYVKSLGEALAVEARGTGVRVTTVCPGNVPSGFQKTAGFGGELPLPGALDPRETARRALDAYFRGSARLVPGLLNKLTALSVGLLPSTWVARISSGALAKMGRF